MRRVGSFVLKWDGYGWLILRFRKKNEFVVGWDFVDFIVGSVYVWFLWSCILE